LNIHIKYEIIIFFGIIIESRQVVLKHISTFENGYWKYFNDKGR